MRLAASTLCIIGIVLATQVHAKDFSIQPLTHVDCDKAEMAWDDSANVCIAGSGRSRQPLSRLGCGMAGMTWKMPMCAAPRLEQRKYCRMRTVWMQGPRHKRPMSRASHLREATATRQA